VSPPSPVLVLSPHTDDAELGCGGTIARFVGEGRPVTVAVFSTAHAPEQLAEEFSAAMRVLDVAEFCLDVFPVREFGEHRQRILDTLISLRDRLQPQLVLMPSHRDVHQDHRVISEEATRAFKDVSCWGYELPWNHRTFTTEVFVGLEQRHIDRKWEALEQYESQTGRSYFCPLFIESLARVRGLQVGREYAEAFDVLRMVV
jgi:LmbE family N-acetylglucosaminyl deacetylase